MTGHTCPVCDASFAAAGGLREHAWDEHGACHYCGDRYGDLESLYTHWLLAHEGDLSDRDRKRASTEVDSIALGDRIEEHGLRGAAGGLSRRTLLLGGGAVLAGGATVGGLAVLGDDGGSDATDADVPIPTDPGEYRYAVAGTGDAPSAITYFGNWKCPFCADFSSDFLPELVADYVEPGDIRIEVRALVYADGSPFLGSDSPAAGRAGLAVWNDDPGSYWAFHQYVYENQPRESEAWATASRLASMAEAAGVSDPSVVRAAVEQERYEERLRATAETASEAGVGSTPVLLIDGEAVPALKRQTVRNRLDDLVG